jgi:hypothetical protein
MDAGKLLGVLRPILDMCEARWMLAGGFAMAAWGSARSTFDLDLVVGEEARTPILKAIATEGFEVLFDSEGFTNLLHPDPTLGRLDILWVEGSTRERMFAAAVERSGPDGLTALVPSPEHLVAMKVKAIRNKPIRVFRDSEDLRLLLSRPEIDQNQAREVFERSGLLELYDRLKAAP